MRKSCFTQLTLLTTLGGNIVLFAATGLTQDLQPPQLPEARFSLTIKSVADVVKVGTPIQVDITLRNDSGQEIWVYRENSEDQGGFVYQATVWDEKMATVRETKFARALSGHITPEEAKGAPYVVVRSGAHMALGPGKTITARVNINRLCDIQQPGKYTIELKRFDLDTKSDVKSNKITITLTP